MKASYPLESAIEKGLVLLALFSTLFLAYPETTVLASSLQTQNGNTAQVFDINSKPKQNLIKILQPVQSSISMGEIVTASDLLAPKLQAYLKSKGSPLGDIDPNWILTQNNSFRAIAISLVESNMCKRTPKVRINGQIVESHNCSGIAGGKRVYPSYQAWFADMNDLLNKPAYVNRPIERFLGFYVVPGSANWLNGVRKVEGDLRFLESQAQQEHLALVKNNNNVSVATAEVELVQK